METKIRTFVLIAILAGITLLVTGLAIAILYHAALVGQRDRLSDTVNNQVRLIESLADIEKRAGKANPDSILAGALRVLRVSEARMLGKTGEIAYGRRTGDTIEFLASRRYEGLVSQGPILFDSMVAQPMHRALSGETGAMRGIDYRGARVLAAYQPVGRFKIGVVAKIDVSEIRLPFIRAGLIALAIAILFSMLGAILFLRITNPMVLGLLQSERKYRHLLDTLQEGVWALDREAKTSFVNPRMAAMLGYTPEEMAGKSLFAFMDERGVDLARLHLQRRSQGIREQHDFEFLTKNGERIYAALETGPLLDEDGRYAGALAGIIDITPRRRMEEALRASEEKFRSVIEQTGDGIVLVDEKGVVVEWNHGAERITGLPRNSVLSTLVWDVQHRMATDSMRTPEAYERLKTMVADFLRTQDASWMHRIWEKTIRLPDGRQRTIQAVVFPVRIERGSLTGAIFRDVTDNKEAEGRLKSVLAEKELLLKEVYHRVKNNFQIVASLLNIQSQQIEDPRTLLIFKESRDRVRTMSMIHERLYRSESLSGIDFGEYVRTLAIELFHSYGTDPSRVTLRVDARDVSLGLDSAIPCGLIVNELVTNCLKYAFPDGWDKKGLIEISIRRTDKGDVRLVVADNGRGLPENLDIHMTKTLGLQLVMLLSEQQLHGKLKVDRRTGTRYVVEFKG
jgi:PAS domain S-box-containing protein